MILNEHVVREPLLVLPPKAILPKALALSLHARSTGYKAALSADLASHTKRLEDAKNQGVRILASQEGFQTGLVDPQLNCHV